jgi:hypothetical protein
MSYRCKNCQSLFFKTLETRVLAENASILYKKRCKRCKFKYLVRKDIVAGQVQPATYQEWALAQKVASQPTRTSERGRVFVSEYTGRVSCPAEEQLPYLHKLRRAQRQPLPENKGASEHGRPKV